MFEPWHDFYLLLGGSAATLVALLFVAASVGAGYLTTERLGEARAFMNPVVVHFTAVFVAAALALAHLHMPDLFVLVVGAGAAVGVVYSLVATRRVAKLTEDATDRLCYGLLPAIAYAAVVAAMALIWARVADAPDVLAGALMVLIVVNIRNAWDLTVDLVRRNSELG
jgi:hypothetical protein